MLPSVRPTTSAPETFKLSRLHNWPMRSPAVPGLRAHLRQIPTGRLPDQEEVASGPHACEAPGNQGNAATTNKQAYPGNRAMACSSRRWLFCLSCRADQWLGVGRGRYHVKHLWHRQLCRRSQRQEWYGRRWRNWSKGSPRSLRFFIRGPACGSPLNTQGRSRVPELGSLGSVRGALRNERPYRECGNVSRPCNIKREKLALAKLAHPRPARGVIRASCQILPGRRLIREDAPAPTISNAGNAIGI